VSAEALEVLVLLGPVVTVVEWWPWWGPVVAAGGLWSFRVAVRETWGTDAGDKGGDSVRPVPGPVPEVGDTSGPTCGDTCPRPSPARETGDA
jgi:hypothetical protein